MCRNIKPLFNFDPPATNEEICASALQYVRKVSGYQKPSKINETAFNEAIDDISCVTMQLLEPWRPRRQRETEKRKQPWPESMLLSNMPNPINKSPWHGVAPIRIFAGWEAVRAYLPLPVFISGYFSIIYCAWPRMTSPSTSATKTKEFRASSICARAVLYACLNSHNGQSRSVQESPCRQAYLLKRISICRLRDKVGDGISVAFNILIPR